MPALQGKIFKSCISESEWMADGATSPKKCIPPNRTKGKGVAHYVSVLISKIGMLLKYLYLNHFCLFCYSVLSKEFRYLRRGLLDPSRQLHVQS